MEPIIQYQTREYTLPSLWSPEIPVCLMLPSLRSITFLPFQKPNGRWYIRFSSPETGTAKLIIGTKTILVLVKEYKGGNPLFIHGPIQKMSKKHYLCHADKTPFFYLADTWWYAMTNRMSVKNIKKLCRQK